MKLFWGRVLVCAGLILRRSGYLQSGCHFSIGPPSTLTVLPGGAVSFTGIVMNNDTADFYLNGDISVLPYTTLAVDDSVFFVDPPTIFSSGRFILGAFI